MPDLNLATEIARFREKLLDLTNRNPLLNYRKSKSRTLQIIDELPDQIFSRLVLEGKRFRFAPIPEDLALAASAQTRGSRQQGAAIGLIMNDDSEGLIDWNSDPGRHSDDKLQTNVSDAKLQSLLASMRRDAATAIEETGVNYLFLAIGMLAWNDSKASERELLAPLILVPVKIDRYFDGRSNQYEYAISWREEEIQDNLCLAKRLAKDFGLRIPTYEDERNPTGYFEDIKRALSRQTDWTVSYDSLLGFFSFQKLLMYIDIDPDNWRSSGRLSEESVVGQVILGQSSQPGDRLYACDYEIDKEPASKKVLLATDADSSQHSALMDIAAGKNLVIEGPPGTGKSQTITNAIAAAIHDGKTVLFVAEKLAALEVVYSKLVELGLADFCLELHSDNASPRQVFESFKKRLGAIFQRPRQLEAIQEELEGQKQLIADYVKASEQSVGPYSEPLHALLWRVIDQRSRGIHALRSAKFNCNISRAHFKENTHQLEAFAETMLEIERPRKSPWWGFWPNHLNPNDCNPVRDQILRLSELAIEAGVASQEIDALVAPATASWVAKSLTEQPALQALRDLCSRATTFPTQLDIQRFLDASTRTTARQYWELVRCAQALKQNVDGLLQVPLEVAVERTRPLQVTLEKKLLPLARHAAWSDLSSLRPNLGALLTALRLEEGVGKKGRPSLAISHFQEAQFKHFLERVERLGRLAKELGLLDEQLDSTVGEGTSAWVRRQLLKTKTIPDLRQLAAKAEGAIDAARARLLLNPTIRKLAMKLCKNLDEFRALATQIPPKLLLEIDNSAQLAATLSSLLTNEIVRVAPKATWGESRNLRIRLSSILAVFASVNGTIEEMRGQGLGNVRNLREYEEAEFLCKLVRHPIVQDQLELPSGLFFRSAAATLQNGQTIATELLERRKRLTECFDLTSVPDTNSLRELTKTLRVYEDSWWRFLRKEFRSARRQLATFARRSNAASVGSWIEGLEVLGTWITDRLRFEENDDSRHSFAELFRGIDTDWDRCKTILQWAATAQTRHLDHVAACELLKLRNGKTLTPQQAVTARKLIVAELTDKATLAALGFPATTTAEIPFSMIVQRAAHLHESLQKMESAADDFGLSDDQLLEDIVVWCHKVQRAAELKRIINDAAEWNALGPWYAALDTDVDSLRTTCQWVDDVAALKLPPSAEPNLFTEDLQQLLHRFASLLDEYSPIANEWQTHVAIFAEIENWTAQIIEPLDEVVAATSVLSLSGNELLCDIARCCEDVNRLAQFNAEIADSNSWRVLEDWYSGHNSELDLLRSVTEWTEALGKLDLSREAELFFTKGEIVSNCERLISFVELAKSLQSDWESRRESLAQFGTIDSKWLPWALTGNLQSENFQTLEKLSNKLDELPAWSSFCRSMASCREQGLTEFIDAVLDGQIEPAQLSSCYQFTVLERIAESVIGSSKPLKTFSRKTIEKARESYQELDRDLLRVNRSLVAHRGTLRRAPAGNGQGKVAEFTEMALIRNEIQKQRRHVRIRDLLRRAGAAAQALKPCFMMSPLSVAQFLAPDGVEFDLVIMDEASQIKPEDAIGTLLRAKQIVVVGDPKQLPPTSFFDRIADGVSDEDATPFDNTESVLEVAMKSFQPVRRLRWHYRSRHESLIHFSNHRFYDGDLIVFPSPAGAAQNLGLRFHPVDGGKFEGGCNPREAEYVARAIVQHALTFPEETLGVGTFNLKQSILIQDWLQKLCESDASARAAVEKLEMHKTEGLFVNNLETLQGHERDVIFISYTYGPDPASGRVMNRFGPVTWETGWRRMNVLITRARRRVEVFASMRPSDIQGGPDKGRGVNAFKDYLEFCSSGVMPDRGSLSNGDMESPFEEAVARVIARLGLEVVPQVGVAGYFIDLGIRLPGTQDFLLGVECDGATYHSARSARDRDRLREEVIRSRGWNLHRIWSTDWYLNQRHEEDRLMKVLSSLPV